MLPTVLTQPSCPAVECTHECYDTAADMMQEDGQEGTAGPSATAGAASAPQTGPLTAAQKTTMGLVLRGMFLEGGAHSVKLAQLVEHYNQKASRPAPAEQVDQVSNANAMYLEPVCLCHSGLP